MVTKRRAKFEVYTAKKDASDERFRNLNDNDKLNHVFQLARKMKSENQDIFGEECILEKEGRVFYDVLKLDARKQLYDALLNHEFDWD